MPVDRWPQLRIAGDAATSASSLNDQQATVFPPDADPTRQALIKTLHDEEQQQVTLTPDEVFTLADWAGRTSLLPNALDQLRHLEVRRRTALLDALPAHVALLDADGVIVAVNEAWRRFGDANGLRDLDHSVGRNYLGVCDQAARTDAAQSPAVAAAVRAALGGERGHTALEYACDSPQEQRRFLLTAVPLEVGRRAGAVIMHVDVSDRARAEQATLHSAELLQAVAEGTPDVVYVKDLEGRYLLCNNALARFTGRPVEQILGRDDLALYGASEAAQIVENDRALIATGAVHTSEKWLTGMSGPRIFNSTRAPYRNARGEVIGVIGIARDITDERLAQQTLRDSQAMLDMAGRMAKVGGWRLDMSNQRLYWSDIVASLHDEPEGYSPSLDEGIDSFVAEYRAGVRAAVERCSKFGVPYDLEVEKISATGRRFWVRTMGEAVRDSTGRIVHIQGALQDITERKLAALETQKLATRLSNTLESISDAFFKMDRDWRFTYINREAERLWGRERDTTLGRVLWDVFPEAVGTAFDHCYQRAMDGETGVSFEAYYPPLQGWFGVDCHPSEDGLSVYFRNVTETRSARQQLKLLEASVAQLNDTVIITEAAPDEPQGVRIVFVNDAFVRMTGYPRNEVLGRSPGLLNGPLTDPAVLDRISAAVTRFEPLHAEMIAYTRSGRAHWIELDITPVATSGERSTHFVSIARDITERRHSEESLRELNASLEGRVRHRTLELERARELAEQANRAKSSFLAMMSHEIRTPMNGVVGMIDVLERSQLAPEQRDLLKTARESAYALMAIVDDVLDFSKIEAGQFDIAQEPMNVVAVVEGVRDALHPLALNQGVCLHLYTDPGLPGGMLGDAARLRQVLMNLLGNAIKFSHGLSRPGAVSLRALREAGPAGADTLVLEVADNGIGMDPDTLARLFSPFTQADASTTRRFGGTGLGLSISHRLLSLMGGEVAVRSAMDEGSTFTVRLPIRQGPTARPPVGVDTTAVPEAPTQQPDETGLGAKPLILVAEDNQINQKVLTQQLSLLGYRAEMVANGAEALARWRQGGHALLLTDLHMPVMDGYTLAAAVRAEEAGGVARLPIIALTANALREEEVRCVQVGMDAYLSKPVRLVQLKAAIDAWLQHAPPRPGVVGAGESAATGAPTVNLRVLADLLGDDPQVMQEVLVAFRASTTGSALAMAQAHSSGEAQTMSDIAHKLKSTARAIGAARLGQTCADIEEAAARRAHAGTLDALMAEFETEMLAVHAFLDQRQDAAT